MADHGAAATSDVLSTKIDVRRAHWKKERVEKRREFLAKAGCNPSVLQAATNEDLVNLCLVAEGLLAGSLPIKGHSPTGKTPVKQTPATQASPPPPPTTTSVDPMLMMMQMMQQMQFDREAMLQAAKLDRNAAEKREQAKLEAAKLEKEAMLEAAKLEREAVDKREQARLEAIEKKEQARLEEAKLEREAIEKREQAKLEAAKLDREAAEARYEKMIADQQVMFTKMNNTTAANNKAERDARNAKENSKESKIKTFGDLLKKVLVVMPSEIADVPMYFEAVERIFFEYNVPQEIKVQLLTPFLSKEAQKLVVTLPEDDLSNYLKFKTAVLREFSLTPNKYRDFFWKAVKKAEETYVQYAKRLETLLTSYLNSREVKDFNSMKSLIVADRMKSDLPVYILRDVNRTEVDTFMSPHELGKFSDRCVNSQDEIKSLGKNHDADNASKPQNKKNKFLGKNKNKVRCFTCNELGHYSTDPVCQGKSTVIQTDTTSKVTASNKSNVPFVKKVVPDVVQKRREETPCVFCASPKRTFFYCPDRESKKSCSYCNHPSHTVGACRKKESKVNFVRSSIGSHTNSNSDPDIVKLLQLAEEHESSCAVKYVSCSNPKISLEETYSNSMRNNIYPNRGDMIKHVNPSVQVPTGSVNIQIGDKIIKCIVDTGTDISVINRNIINSDLLPPVGSTTIKLMPAFGDNVQAQLANLPLSVVKPNGKYSDKVFITCAVTDKLNSECLLTAADYLYMLEAESTPGIAYITGSSLVASNDIAQLKSTNTYEENEKISDISAVLEMHIINANNKTETFSANTAQVNKVARHKIQQLDEVPLGAVERAMELHDQMVDLQNKDDSLKSCRDMARSGNSDFFFRDLDKLLYRKTKMYGFQIYQLVLPESKRLEVIKLAHDSNFGGHFATKKTLQRIHTNFYWPSMKQDVSKYTQSCEECQKHRRVTVYDRVPISAVARPSSFCDTLSVDMIGPLEPASSRGHKYILCVVDQTTRWPEVVCLKSITAVNTCNALLKVFCRIGFPRVIVSDNGSNFVSSLTKEFYRQLGVELRTSSPYHPEANAVVERFNQTLKRLMHHIVNSDKPREWETKIEYLLWAYRSSPHSTTGLSPYQMVYGKIPRGILSTLRDNMTGLQTTHPHVSGSVKDYCEKIAKDLKISHDLADAYCDKAQKQYVTHYNLRSKDKSFEPGNQVLVLFPDSTNKLISKFQGPAVVKTKLNNYAYIVEMPDGTTRRLHANKLRLYVPRVQLIGVVFDDETDFGDIPCYPDVLNDSSDIDFSCVSLTHLDPVKQTQIKQLILKHKAVFSDKPGRCSVGEHRIDLTPGFIPKRKPPYRVPEKLKIEIDRQVEGLLKEGLISETTSEWAHPIVCVAKPDDSIRICVNYKDVNKVTIPDRYPMVRIDDLLQVVGNSSFISTLDNTAGYWQIPVHPDSRDKTAFVTHRGSYQWNVLSFGLRNAGATFQKTVNQILKPHRSYASAYIDDTSVYSNTWEDHLEHLDSVIGAFGQFGMTLRLSKCKFGMPTVKYVGHKIGSGTIQADQSKIEAILNIKMPTTKKLLRSFIGMTNYYQKYIPNLSARLVPLTKLTKSKLPNQLQITDDAVKAFEDVKSALCSTKVLRTARFDRDFIVQTDASDYAVGACLSQLDDEGCEHPIAFASEKFSDVQSRWSTIEKEGYAIIFALRKFDHYIFGHNAVVVYSDHNPLHFLIDATPKSSKLTRWMLALQRYNITVEHRAGSKNANCDALSRL